MFSVWRFDQTETPCLSNDTQIKKEPTQDFCIERCDFKRNAVENYQVNKSITTTSFSR